MEYKTLLLASFIDKNYLTNFLLYLNNTYGVLNEKIFIFELIDESYLLTYKIKIDLDRRFDIKKELPKTIQIHKKKSSFFTINALNKLIEKDSGLSVGNINHKEHNIDWNLYENKLILLKDDKLDISDIKRVFLSDL